MHSARTMLFSDCCIEMSVNYMYKSMCHKRVVFGPFGVCVISSFQTWNVCQADTELFQVVTMPTFVLHGVHPMYVWRTVHV